MLIYGVFREKKQRFEVIRRVHDIYQRVLHRALLSAAESIERKIKRRGSSCFKQLFAVHARDAARAARARRATQRLSTT